MSAYVVMCHFLHTIVQFVSRNNPSYLIIIKIAIYFLIILCIIFELTLITQLLKLYYKPIKSSNFMKETSFFACKLNILSNSL